MDEMLRQLKKQAWETPSGTAMARYARALERLHDDEVVDLSLYLVLGHGPSPRCWFQCLACDETAVRAQFEEALKQTNWGTILWDHVFEDYAGPVDGWNQPMHILVDSLTPLPLQELPKRALVITIEKISLGQIKEHS